MSINYGNFGSGNQIIPKMVYKEQKHYYLDIDGSISDGFISGTVYAGGFCLVRTDPNKKTFRFRDMLGNITLNKTEKGKDFYEFWRGNLDFEDLNPIYFTDEKFYRFVKMIMIERERSRAHYMIERCEEKREVGFSLLQALEEKNI